MSKKLDALLAKTKKLIKKMSTILNLCKLYRFMNWILVWRQIILTIGNINPKLITIIARKNSLFIIRSLAILKIENSDVKNQNSSIFAIGSITPIISRINSMKLKKKNNYVSVDLKSWLEISWNFVSSSMFSNGTIIGSCMFIILLNVSCVWLIKLTKFAEFAAVSYVE